MLIISIVIVHTMLEAYTKATRNGAELSVCIGNRRYEALTWVKTLTLCKQCEVVAYKVDTYAVQTNLASKVLRQCVANSYVVDRQVASAGQETSRSVCSITVTGIQTGNIGVRVGRSPGIQNILVPSTPASDDAEACIRYR